MDKDNKQTPWFDFETDYVPSSLDIVDEDMKIEFCIHEWTKYEGFTDVFEYCKKCDTKNR